ncbi:T-cell ecto-ADP-ribosyltransferase 2-like [Myotis daubentonii]|uniref:T-cell ecto-ADP-ribosyltransferase 2-like n=1 Tax=Myotis daubentonii TaxID=98922 RepID=UPI00287314CA|nr:T-cell ecto-ADP-ribosyltransferase 2-like [Myotis daubentonii]
MTSLLATAVRFLILTPWLTRQVTGRVRPADPCELDMADDVFDDQYDGCIKEMEAKAPQLLEEELKVNRNLNTEWKKAKTKWKEIKNKIDSSKQLKDSHGIALVAYTGDIGTEFNKAVRNFRQNTNKFQFKAFHYYLTRALQLLKTKDCYTVYRGYNTKCNYIGKGNVRFGQFASSSLAEKVAINFTDNRKGTLFTIRTCLGVKIEMFSYIRSQKEVLIPGYEEYQKVIQNNNDVSLDRPKISKSNYNCFYINSSGMKESSAFILLLPGLLVLRLLPAEL